MSTRSRQLQVRFFAVLRDQAGCASITLQSFAPDATALYAELQGQFPGLTFPGALLRVALNERFADLTAPLADGDRVVFIPPVAGG